MKKRMLIIAWVLSVLCSTKAICQTEPRLDDPVVPDSLLDNRPAAYQFYKDHYWDNCQLDDSTLVGDIRFVKRIYDCFDKVVAPLPDSIMHETDRFIAKIQNKAVRDFALCLLLDKYEYPAFMTQDTVFIYLAERYFLKEKDVTGMNQSAYTHIADRVETMRRLALSQPAPELILRNANNECVDIHSIESEWLVLFFYDHECDVCEEEASDLIQLMTRHKGIKVCAIDVNRTFVPLHQEFINLSAVQYVGNDPVDTYDLSDTPLLFLLDRDKRIAGKRISAKQIPILIK